MKLLGLDIGTKRIGVATADLTVGISLPKTVVAADSRADALTQILSLAEAEGAEQLVIGLPLTAAGSDSDSTKYVREFADELEKSCTVKVCLWDERFTSQQSEKAYRSGNLSASAVRKKGLVDMMSAVYILDSYMQANAEALS